MRSLPKFIRGLPRVEEVYRIPDPQAPKTDEVEEETAAAAEETGAEDTAPPAETAAERQAREEKEAARRAAFLEERARARAEEISQKILQNAKTERLHMLDAATTEAAKIRESARREAYEEALGQKRGEIVGRLGELDSLMDRLQSDYSAFVQKYEDGLRSLALEIAEKLVGETVTQHAEMMVPLVQKAVAALKNEEWISVEISARLPGLAQELRTQLEGRADGPRVEVTETNAPPGSCVLHTPGGVVDASVDTQLNNLKNLFDNMG